MAKLSLAKLIEADLSDADLSDAKLSLARLSSAKLIKANLSRADLSEADLSRANLSDANLSQANLSRAILSEVDLSGAILSWANLSQANLSRANLIGARLGIADLRRADLSGANLSHAILSSTSLTGANFGIAKVGWTTFVDIDFSEVQSLNTVRHEGPSTIDINTIYRSQGKIPPAFLRRAGVPDNFIEYMGSLTAKAFEFYSCFISYSSIDRDQEFAKRLYEGLQNQGVRCWFAPEDLKTGDRFQEVIEQSIRIYDKLLLILSDNSVASPWVEREVQSAMEKERRSPGSTVLFPVRLDDAVMDANQAWAADIRRTRHIGDFRNWKDHDSYQKAFQRLLRDLKAKDSKTG